MGFRINKTDNINFDTPQEMYSDYKNRKINGPLDYQSDMIDLYMEEAFEKTDVALELPTGSGKTLIGLLIGEFRRRKYNEKIVYLCPTNQLVNQTVDQARGKYGIKAQKFTGKIVNYSPEAKSAYSSGSSIAITNYSSLFNTNTYFDDADIIIFDDAHAAENYIASNWTVQVKKEEHKQLFYSLVESISEDISDADYNKLTVENPTVNDLSWFDKLPNVKLLKKLSDIYGIIESHVYDTKLKYSWSNIRDNLHACNMFLSCNEILIRPYIPPTLTHEAFSNAKQRIYMSATLGESGELERVFGISKIHRLPMVQDWNHKSIGRKFFMFPNASFENSKTAKILMKINEIVDRALMLVQDTQTAKSITNYIEENSETEVFSSNDIEKSKEKFINSSDGLAILANRFDGIDLSDDQCRMLVMYDLPTATHLQEKFLTTRMAASIIFNERIKTRIVQAVGRCTRNPIDYAAVCVFGDQLMNSLISPKKINQYNPEMQAEIEFGYDQSIDQKSIDDYLGLLKLFFERGEEWEEAEKAIIESRDQKIEEGLDIDGECFKLLLKSAKYEVKAQYALWSKDDEYALTQIEKIVEVLDKKKLRGYQGFWYYIGGYISYKLYKEGNSSYKRVSKRYFENAAMSTKSITWFNKLLKEEDTSKEIDYFVSDIIDRVEKQIIKYGIKRNNQFEDQAKKIMSLLNDNDGNKFERGHKLLGKFLGYISNNSDGHADPDPWWIINDNICIVAEDKIYKSSSKSIPPKHVKQASGHENWIKENIKTLSSDARIETIFITTSEKIRKPAAIHGENIWYIKRKDFIKWAERAINCIRILRRDFEEGDVIWREKARDLMIEKEVTPKHYLDFIMGKDLYNLTEDE